MRIEEAVTKAWASVLTEQILQEVMSGLRQMKFDLMLSGEDSGLKNVWEEVCVQVQLEESFFWDAYLETIEQAIAVRLDELDRAVLLALWSTTDSGWDWIFDHHGDKDGDHEAPVDQSEIISALRGKLLAMAADYTNSNISRFHALHYGCDYYEGEEDDEEDADEEGEEDFEEEAEDDYPITDQEPRAEAAQPVVNDPLTTESAPIEDSRIVEPDQSAFVRPADYGKNNKLVTEADYLRAREVLRKKLSQLNAGIDPEMLQGCMMMAGDHIESGARAWAAYSKAMIADLGDKVRPYLRSFYEGARYFPGLDTAGMDDAAAIEKAIAADKAPAFDPEKAAGEKWNSLTPVNRRNMAISHKFDPRLAESMAKQDWAALTQYQRASLAVDPKTNDFVVKEDEAVPADYGKNNKIFTEEAYLQARERLRKKLAQLNTGLDPEMLQAGMTLDQARADLAGLEQRLKEDQGPVTDARLEDRMREYRNLVSEMEAKQAESVVNDQLTTEGQAQGGTNAAIPATPSAQEMADLKAQMDQAIAELASILGAQVEPNRGATYQAGSGGAQALNESGDGGNLPG
jgi:hypothetical protein